MEDPVEDATLAAMQKMPGGFRVSQMIAVAAKLRVADHLKEGPRTVRDLARVTESHEDALYRVLRTLTCVGVFAEENGRSFRLTPTSELLLSDVPGSLRVAAEVLGEEWTWPNNCSFPTKSRSDPPPRCLMRPVSVASRAT